MNRPTRRTTDPNLPRRDFTGALIGDVRVASVIHQSPRAIVLLGTQEGIGRLAVVKLMSTRGTDTHEASARILKNAHVLGQLRHANIATLYNMGMFEGEFPYLVMEYISGGTVLGLLEHQGPLAPTRALGMLQQVAHALEDVHKQGLLHHNLSLDNLLVESLAGSNHDLVKLTNFGLGDPEDELDEDGYPISHERALHMTPEEGLGGVYTEASDLYVCGVMLYQLLTGQMPYRTLEIPELWDEIVSRGPIPLAEASPGLAQHPELQDLIDQIMARNPAARPSNARAMRLMLGQTLDAVRTRDAALTHHVAGSFPVLNTIERLPAIPPELVRRPAPIPEPTGERPFLPSPPSQRPTAPLPPRPSLPQEPRTPAPEPQAAPLPNTPAPPRHLEDLNLDHLTWTSPSPENLAAARDVPYLVLNIHSPMGLIPPGLAQPLELLLGATLAPDTIAMVFRPTGSPEKWLGWLSARARQHHLCMGFAFGRRFDALQNVPAPYTIRMALQSAQRATPGELVAARHAVDALSLVRYFTTLSSRLAGRYSSFMAYTGLAP